ncbi:MAG TPA: hypothetical protein VH370_19265 [Humisphaera sp.]|nr:hypothetical protein [Humisphaera sp.]
MTELQVVIDFHPAPSRKVLKNKGLRLKKMPTNGPLKRKSKDFCRREKAECEGSTYPVRRQRVTAIIGRRWRSKNFLSSRGKCAAGSAPNNQRCAQRTGRQALAAEFLL